MTFLHYLRTSVNKLIGPFGLELEKIEKQKWELGNPMITLQIGRYCIELPKINPLVKAYRQQPHLATLLGRLTSVIRKKYPSMAAIDVGANVGDTACIIKSSEDVPILCIEGDDYSFKFLQKNINQFENVTAHKMFLGEKSSLLKANLKKIGWNTTILPDESEDATPIKLVSLDDFLSEYPDVSNFKLLKIDTEGFDCSILRGGLEFIKKNQPVITFEYNRKKMEAL